MQTSKETKSHGLSYAAKKVQRIAHDVIDQLDIAMEALRDIKENGKGKKKAALALERIRAVDFKSFEDSAGQQPQILPPQQAA